MDRTMISNGHGEDGDPDEEAGDSLALKCGDIPGLLPVREALDRLGRMCLVRLRL